jgi:hypothetical protein
MKTWRTAVTTLVLAASLAAADPAPSGAILARPEARPGVASYADPAGDVAKPKLDLRRVVVRNTADRVTVRLYFPGTRTAYDYPLGYLAVHLDTDRTHRGPEYGHFMQFWSDYRFGPTRGWREAPAPEWGHSPEGECVADAGLRSDAQRRLRWFELTVRKREGCFEADAVRVAVTTVNEGENHPYRPYAHPYVDHLTARHAWTRWVPAA